jgi:threonine dehydrogenase-like Zn-dependent dehydrogenase
VRKALVYAPEELRLVDLPERQPGPGEIAARMLVTSLTTANVRLYQGPLLADLQYPVTLSYTGVAEVAAIGDGVGGFAVGDLVYPNFYRACLECRWCRADKLVACEKVGIGEHNMMVGERYESALQEMIVFPARRFYRVPPGADVEKIAMTGFMSVAMQAICAVGLGPDDPAPRSNHVFINGAGPIGWCAIQLARLKGVKTVVTEVRPTRMERARQMGADAVIDAAAPDAMAQVIEACGGAPELIIEASGTDAGSKFAFDIAARGAVLAVVGVAFHPVTQHAIILKGLSVHGIGGAIKVQQTIDLIAGGQVDISSAISHRYRFSDLKDAFEFKRATPEAELVAIYVDESRMPG